MIVDAGAAVVAATTSPLARRLRSSANVHVSRSLSVAFSIALLAFAPLAHAEAPPPGAAGPQPQGTPVPPVPQPAPVERHYGAQIVLPDLVGMSFIATYPSKWGWLGVAEWGLTGPVVHAVHGNYGRAAGSLGLRVAGLAGVVAVLSASWGDHYQCDRYGSCPSSGLGAAGIGILAGVSLLDGLLLARDTVEPEPPRVTPTVAVTRDGAYVGAGGTF